MPVWPRTAVLALVLLASCKCQTVARKRCQTGLCGREESQSQEAWCFQRDLAALGYVEGRNIRIEYLSLLKNAFGLGIGGGRPWNTYFWAR
jgi:hypothetical protein